MRKENLGKKTKLLWQNSDYREHMKQAHIGQKAWNKGIKTGLVPKTAFIKGHKPSENWYKAMAKNRGSANHKWKEKNITYGALHDWIKREYGKSNKCENNNCIYPRITSRGKNLIKPIRFEWANIDGIYNRERRHWKMLCSSCHRLLDNGRITI